jgi:hypothetical protein
MKYPRITDDDNGTITADLNGEVVRSWAYPSPEEHKPRMLLAREFAEGWFQAVKRQNVGRTERNHNHYFACIGEAFNNLPEHYAQEFPTEEHLRKWCLIRCGYHDSRSIVAASKAEAVRLAAFVKPMDDFAVVVVDGATVTAYTAKSQSLKAMGNTEFKASKQDVLDMLAVMLDVTPLKIQENAGKSA